MRISNYPTDTLDGTELILATNQDTTTQKYKTVNFTIDTLKTYIHTDVNDGIDKIIFEGDTKNDFETTLNASDPTADRAISLPNQSGTIPVFAVGISGNTAITATPDELNIIDGVTATTAEINYLDITTLGTVEASKVLTADANGDVLFPDNEILKFGTGGDLKIYYDGGSNNHSYISHEGTGVLNIQSTTDDVSIKAPNGKGVYLYVGGQNGIRTFHGGASELYYANVKRFNTESTGVTVTGNATCSGELTATSYTRSLGTHQVVMDSANAAAIQFGSAADWDAYGYISTSGGAMTMENVAGSSNMVLKTTGVLEFHATSLTVGVDDAGHDVKFFGDTASRYMLWDTSDDKLNVQGSLDVLSGGTHSGSTIFNSNLTANGIVQISGNTQFGVNDTGVDVKFFGDTAGKYLLWDASEDQLIINGDVGTQIVNGGDNTNPSIYWGTDTNTGIYHDSDNAIKITINGTKRVEVGAGYLQVYGDVIATEDVKAAQFKLSALNTAPSSASDTGTLGEVRIDASYIYVCTASNTWKRAQIATW